MQKVSNRVSWSLVVLLLTAMTTGTLAQDVRTIIVKEGQGARDLAQEAFGNPDLWNEILKANQLSSPSDIQPGMKLVVPVGAIRRAAQEVDRARQAIQMATDVGARVFAAETIGRAISTYDDAVRARSQGEWDNCVRLAGEASRLAEKAHQESLEKRNTSADATVTDRSGTVQNRTASEMLWRDLDLYAKLYENYRVRTLSNSYAEISFQDQSRIRLNENSQAVIQKMRVDLLNKERDSSVKLEKGAAFALLQSNQKKKKFNLNIPGVKTEINSKNFWVQKDEEVTKIANYEGEIKLTTDEKEVVLEENFGSQISADGSLGKSRGLLRGTSLLAPKNNEILAGGAITLQWQPVDGAQRYMLQVSADYSFTNIIINRDDILYASFATEELKDGAYYWTVAAIDKEGFPSPSSPRGFFYIFSDTENPFLYINHPGEQAIFQSDTLHIVGETEANVTLMINGQEAKIAGAGQFRLPYTLKEGINKIEAIARDPGGNETRIVRTVLYAARTDVTISYDPAMKQLEPKRFLARGRTLEMKGTTTPLSSVSIRNQAGEAKWRTFADSSGYFQLSLLDLPESMPLTLSVLTPTGYSKEETIQVQVSSDAPRITLSSQMTPISAEETVMLEGTVANTTRLTCNGVQVPMTGSTFKHSLQLQPGKNTITLIAFDDMDNQCVVQNEIMLDKTPPELLDHSLLVKATATADVIDVKVKARDSSGLRRTASIELLAGDMLSSGFLLYNAGTQMYEGSFKYPRGALKEAKAKLKTLVLEDYYGNQSVLNPQ